MSEGLGAGADCANLEQTYTLEFDCEDCKWHGSAEVDWCQTPFAPDLQLLLLVWVVDDKMFVELRHYPSDVPCSYWPWGYPGPGVEPTIVFESAEFDEAITCADLEAGIEATYHHGQTAGPAVLTSRACDWTGVTITVEANP